MKVNYFAGIDIGGTKIASALATPKGKIIKRAKSPTPKDASAKKIVRIVSDLLEEMLYAEDLSKKHLTGIGVGVPGIIATKNDKIIRTPNMNLSGISLKKLLEKELRIKCAIGNDANLGTLGEKWLGAAKNAKDLVGLFIGTGVGAGIITDGHLLTGSHGAAAEIGHMIVRQDGPRCGCGNRGCLEAFCGRWAIEQNIRRAIKSGEKTVITKLLDRKSGSIKSKFLRKALQLHDRLTVKIITAAAKELGKACISIRHILDPEMIVLGGGVMEACGDFMLPIVRQAAFEDRFFSNQDDFKISLSELEDDAIVIGAIALIKSAS